jgi:hypothetical protein
VYIMLYLLRNRSLSSTLLSAFSMEVHAIGPLGRWKIENEDKTNLKADYANDDHCGICSQFTQLDQYEEEYRMHMIEFIQDDPFFHKENK